jgi:hypothetical protein
VLDDLPTRGRIEVFLAAAILGKIEERSRNRETDLLGGGDQVITALNAQAGVAEALCPMRGTIVRRLGAFRES